MRKPSSFQKSFLPLALVLAILLTAALPAMGAETVSDAASTIQLMKTEGSVSVTNGSGRALSVFEDMRLYNGYHAKTAEKSYAWASLDSSKLIKLDAVSEAEVRKAGKKLEVLLNSGNLYFNVSEPLEKEESLNIRTSTIIVGIRGTCGWVKMLDAWRAQVYLLEGQVECSVTDPATGESRTTVLRGGEMAEFVVYPQGQAGARCEIIRQSYTEEQIDGFVLVELVKDRALCEKIYTGSGLDVLGRFDQDSAQKRLEDDQAAMEEVLREIEKALSTQDNHVSQDPVWDSGPKDSGGQDSGGSSAPGGDSPGVAPEPADITLTMPVTDMDVQQSLDRPTTRRVVVAPGANPAQNTLDIGINMTVDSGKTLTLNSGVPAQVLGSLTVNGTADLGDSLANSGAITVNSSNTLRVAGQFVNNAGGTITNTSSGRIAAALGISSEGTLTNAGRVEGRLTLTGGSLTISGGEITSNQDITVSVSSGTALTLAGGAVTNTGDGAAIGLPSGFSLPAGFATDFRAKTLAVASPFPSGYGAAQQSDGYYHLAETVTAGSFAVNGGKEGVDYTYDESSGKFSVISPTPLTISMAEGVDQTTTDSIFVEDGVSANLTLAGVNIDLSHTGEYTTNGTTGTPGAPAFQIADNSSGNVSLTLGAGTENTLLSGAGRAGLEKNSKESSGRLTIKGTGKLTATGGRIYMNATPDIDHGGAGIGACGFPNNGNSTCANITIESGEISATSTSQYAIGIGDEIGAAGIQITGGTVTVPGAHGILGTDITISGGTVNGTVALMSEPGTPGQLTISGGEIVCSKNGSAVSVQAPAQMNFTGGTVTQIIEGMALRLYDREGSDTLIFPTGCATVFRSTQRKIMDPLPDGWGVEQRDDGYYYLFPWSTAAIEYSDATTAAIQTALNSYDEVRVTNEQGGPADVTFDSDLTVPAGKVLSLSDDVDLVVSGSAALVNNGTIELSDRALTVDGTLTNSGTIVNCGYLALTAPGSRLVMLDGEISGRPTASWLIGVPNADSLELIGGRITCEDNSHAVMGPFGSGALQNVGTEIRGKSAALLKDDTRDITEAMGCQALRMADDYYYLEKKEENP